MNKVVARGLKCSLVIMGEEYIPLQVVYLNDPRINNFLLSRGPFNEEKQKERLRLKQEKGEQVLAIIIPDSSNLNGWRFVGVVELRDFDHIEQSAFSASFLGDVSCWGKGIAKEAKLLQLRVAFEELGLRSVFATTVGPNTRSQKLLESVGYKLIGVRPKARNIGTEVHDEFLYCVSVGDWRSVWLSYLIQHE